MKKDLKVVQIILLIVVMSGLTGTIFAKVDNKAPAKIHNEPVCLGDNRGDVDDVKITLYQNNMEIALENMEKFLASQEETREEREEQAIMYLAEKEKEKLRKELEEKEKYEMASRGSSASKYEQFVITAYDLSYKSCGKVKGDKYYGITSSGASLTGKTREQAMAVATDPNLIPTGSKIEIIFIDEKYQHFNGVYTALDTGGAIKGKIIDLFMGDFDKYETDQSVWDFGRRQAYVRVLELPRIKK